LVLFLTWVMYDYFRVLKLKGNMKGPTIYPLILNDYLLLKYDRTTMITKLFEKYGETTYFFSNNDLIIFTINPDNIQHMISQQHNFSNYKRTTPSSIKSFIAKKARLLFGDGIFAADDEVWEIQRLHAMPMFKRDQISLMSPIFVKKGKMVLDLLKNENLSKPIDVQNLYMRYTLDSFGEIAFGIPFEGLSIDLEFPRWFDTVQRMIIDMSIKLLKRNSIGREYVSIIQKLDKFVYDLIQKKKKETNLELNTDLISKFLCLRDADGKQFPDKWIRDIVMNFIIAGRDTTATLLTWTSYLLAKHPEVAEKALEEIKSLKGEDLTYNNIKNLKYLDYIIKESLRLYAPVPGVRRSPLKPDVLPDNTKVSTDTRLKYMTYFLHRSPKYWDDPLLFKPERWANQKEIIKHSYQYLPFHGGPMSCIGRKMAELEAKTLLIIILQNYKFELDSNAKYLPFLGIITNCEGGCPLYLKGRNES